MIWWKLSIGTNNIVALSVKILAIFKFPMIYFLSSSSMQEHKRRICCGLSSCCSQPDDVLMIDNAKLSCCQKMSKCCCLPFQSSCKPCRRKKVTQLTSEQRDTIKTSIWRKICCCSSCCKKQDKVRFICSYAIIITWIKSASATKLLVVIAQKYAEQFISTVVCIKS